jgi:hypothetical protein
LNVANTSQLDAFAINDGLGTGQPTFYLDEIQLTAVPEPTPASISGFAGVALAFSGLIRRAHLWKRRGG